MSVASKEMERMIGELHCADDAVANTARKVGGKGGIGKFGQRNSQGMRCGLL
jgi:hypothetical protein